MSRAKKFMELFDGLLRAYGIYVIDNPNAPGKKKGEASTLQQPVTEALWDQHLSGEIQLGIVPIRDDGSCLFGAIDIDDYKLDHAAIEAKIKKLKLPLVLVRSKSGGGHCYMFLKKQMAAETLRETLSDYAAQLGYAKSEIFPKQNRLASVQDTGNWINMPYCGAEKSERVAIVEGKGIGPDEFLELAAKKSIDPRKVERAIDDTPEILAGGPPCLATLAAQGVPEGTRNLSMFNFGVYAKRRWPDDWEERVRDINRQFLNPALEEGEMNQIIAHLAQKEYSYTCRDKPLNAVCQKNTCLKRKYGIQQKDAQEYFGFGIENVTRIETAIPTYFADFNGKRITFKPETINNQKAFRGAVIAKVNESFLIMPESRWGQLISNVLASATIVEAPPETREDAQLWSALEDYCTETPPARDWSDVIDGLVMTDGDRMLFRPEKFVAAVNREQRSRLKTSDVYTDLIMRGIVSTEREINGKTFRLWSVAEFQRAKRKKKADDAETM